MKFILNLYSLLKKYRILIIAIIALLSTSITIWDFKTNKPLNEVFEKWDENEKELISKLDSLKIGKDSTKLDSVAVEVILKDSTNTSVVKANSDESNYKKGYGFSYKIGFLVGLFGKRIYVLISILTLGFLIARGSYLFLFKSMFVEEGIGGKWLYFFTNLLLFFFIYLILKSIFKSDNKAHDFLFTLSGLWVGFAFLYSIFAYVKESFTKVKELKVQKTKAELMALKAQINPHFLFNVLNNIYGQAIIEDSPKTASGIEQLSRIMRHVVEETKTEHSPISKELLFLDDYIQLQKMRIPDRPNITIETKIDWDETPGTIAPLLFIPYLENSFKYGISMNELSFIKLKLKIINGILHFNLQNSIIKKTDKLEVGTNTGLNNTEKRLQLYYPETHKLTINTNNGIFEVDLKLKLENVKSNSN